jgi:hypothetical protein
MKKSYEKHIRGNAVFLCSMTDAERKEYFADQHREDQRRGKNWQPGVPSTRDWGAEPRYVIGRGGNAYPAEFIEMFPYTYGKRH